jgi:hypothetical protein
MISITQLWLPILLSAVAIFAVSSLIHMVLPWHKSDYRKLPQEDQVLAALRPFSIPPADYLAPRPDNMQDMGSDAFRQKVTLGPRLVMTVMPSGSFGMARNLVGWFIYTLLIAAIVGGLCCLVFPAGADGHNVFHVALIAGALAYAGGLWQMSIWYHRSIATTVRSTIDGIIYAAIIAGLLAYFWPS